MDQGHFVGMVILDLHNAFDPVDHDILLMKLKALDPSQIFLLDSLIIIMISATASECIWHSILTRK